MMYVLFFGVPLFNLGLHVNIGKIPNDVSFSIKAAQMAGIMSDNESTLRLRGQSGS
jgi:hypothetical protein